MSNDSNLDMGLLESGLAQVVEVASYSSEAIFHDFYGYTEKQFDMAAVRGCPDELCDKVADNVINWAKMQAATVGAGFGTGGLLTIVPDLCAMATIILRGISGVSIAYGFPVFTSAEKLECVKAWGVSLGVSSIHKTLGEAFIKEGPKYVMRTPYSKSILMATVKAIAKQLGLKVTKRWFVKAIPFVASVLGGALNYMWADQALYTAKEYFQEKRKFCKANQIW
ncbi:MAG: EcsC family protein [Candidatus Cloacimonetes bacterium]|nr:EcsC family protein [Candidatus Cloacimonadota bacterium]